jgi:hypothetical protein
LLGRHSPVFGFDLNPKHVALPTHDEIRHALREISAPGNDADLQRAHIATVKRAEVLYDVPLNDALGLRLRSRLALTKGSHGVVIARMEKKIKIACTGAMLIDVSELVPMQGDLKDLSEENYEKLKKDIIKLGFSEPISAWKNNEGQWCLLNGHQRTRVLLRMRDEGWEIPSIPISIIEADDYKQALEKILSLTSQFGEITRDGLYKFITSNDINPNFISEHFNFAEINMPKFMEEFFNSPSEQIENFDENNLLVKEFICSVKCKNETDLQIIYDEMIRRGFECKIIT